MYRIKSYRLKVEEYNYLLPVLRDKLLHRGERSAHYFCGSPEDLYDILARLKGLYNYFREYNPIIDYKCFKSGSLEPFREFMKTN